MNFAERFGPWALITGASAGLGREFARSLAARGLNLGLTARRAGRLEELAEELRSAHGIEIRRMPLDLTADDAMQVLAAGMQDLPVGLLINNAGFGFSGSFLEEDLTEIRRMTRLNCEAAALLARTFLPPMAERGRGGMILVSSMAGLIPTPWMSLYGATKAFDLFLGEGLAVEMRAAGVDVLTLCPGPTGTEFHQVSGVSHPAFGKRASARKVTEQAIEALGRRQVLVPGAGNRLMVRAPRLLPRRLVAWSAGRTLGARLKRQSQPPSSSPPT